MRFVNEVFKDLISEDNNNLHGRIVIPGNNYEHAYEKLVRTLKTAEEHGLNINWHKSSFLKTKIEFLGHEVENGHVRPAKAKIKAVTYFPEPTSKLQVVSFLGLTGLP